MRICFGAAAVWQAVLFQNGFMEYLLSFADLDAVGQLIGSDPGIQGSLFIIDGYTALLDQAPCLASGRREPSVS